MTDAPRDRRPKSFPPPQFPPARPKLFAQTPPALFLALLGLLGLGLALRKAAQVTGLPGAPVEAALGALVVIWVFAVVAIKAKVLRRFGTLTEDLATIPGRAGLAGATMSGMVLASVVLPYSAGLATVLAFGSLIAHGIMAAIVLVVMARQPAAARRLTPVWHLTFVGFVAAAAPLAELGWSDTARDLLFAAMPLAALIWGVSAAQLVARVPPAPLRPLLVLHLAPAALFAAVAAQLGLTPLALGFAGLAGLIFVLLVLSARWITEAGFSALWGAMTFPLAALAGALLTLGGGWTTAGLVLTALATPLIVTLGWRILRLWPGGKLAARTNAAAA